MKKSVITAALLCALSAPAFAADSDTADPGDPCAMVLCLAGKLNGSSPAECDPMYKNFMSIKKKKDGSFLPDHTAAARQRKLSACPTADSGLVNDIIKRFGRLKGW
ncbi:TrbM/KikA/MpfK family conjugal transfer protein [Enterobacter asburiae]|uniref:TrbM/KikA/MpfK family conjugal transfer protein n=1 Tax=Enterobacter asburiae TaxID=61645 RepID=UPI003F43478B